MSLWTGVSHRFLFDPVWPHLRTLSWIASATERMLVDCDHGRAIHVSVGRAVGRVQHFYRPAREQARPASLHAENSALGLAQDVVDVAVLAIGLVGVSVPCVSMRFDVLYPVYWPSSDGQSCGRNA